MKEKKREGAKQGGYLGVFKELVRRDNKVGLVKSKDGHPRLVYHIEPTKGDKPIPMGVRWDFKDPTFRGTLGCFGVPLAKVYRITKERSIEEALIYIEKIAQKKALQVAVYVPEDGDFGAGLHPAEGEFIWEFHRISSRDKNDAPVWNHVHKEDLPSPKGGTWTLDRNEFRVQWRVLAGERKNALVSQTFAYSIEKDEEDEWTLNLEGTDGKEFKALFALHGINLERINPDRDFKNPENGLPELEKLLIKRRRPLSGSVKESWVKGVSAAPEGMVDREVDEGSIYKADKELIERLFVMIGKRVKGAWAEEGQLSKLGERWLTERRLPTNFTKLSDAQVKKYMQILKTKHPLAG